MKIVLFLPDISRIGGVERVVANRSSLFAELPGYEVTILSCFNTNNKIPYHLHQAVNLASLNVPHYPSNPLKKITWYLSLLEPLKHFLELEHPDVVFAEGSYLCSTLAMVKNSRIIKVGCEHISFGAVNLFHKILRKILYPKLDHLVVLTKRDKDFFLSFLENVTCIPNFITTPTFQSALTNRLIVSAGRLTAQKGFDLLLRAFEQVSSKHPHWRLIIFGEGEEREHLENLTQDLGLTEVVSLPGQNSNLSEQFRDASIFVMSSRFEGHPLTLLEAMSVGLPCVSFSCSGPDEIIDDSINGYLVPQEDVSQLAEKINLLIQQPEVRSELAINAKMKVNQYSSEAIRQKWLALFDRIK